MHKDVHRMFIIENNRNAHLYEDNGINGDKELIEYYLTINFT